MRRRTAIHLGQNWTTQRISWRALTLLTAAAIPFITTSILWLRRPSDYLALYGIAPTALVLVGGTISYALFAQGRASERERTERGRGLR